MTEQALVQAVKEAFVILAGCYPKLWEPTKESVQSWLTILEGQDASAIVPAVISWCRDDNKFPPSPGEIYRRIPANCRCNDCIRCNSRALERRLQIDNRRQSDSDWRTILPPRPTPLLEEGK